MQLANCVVAIGGDTGNTVGKYAVTASEIALLRAIHGDDSVNEIEVIADDPRTNRSERERLIEIYGRAKDGADTLVFPQLFPGVAARMFEKIEELELDDSFFKATGRATAAPAGVAEEEPVEEEVVVEPPKPPKPLTAAQKKAQAAQAAKDKKAQLAAEKAAAAAKPEVEENDGVEDMDDGEGVLA